MSQTPLVWVAYATQQAQFHIAVDFWEGMTAQQAIENSKIQDKVELPENFQCGIFGVKVSDLSQPIQVGDRIEIYRALMINPKDIRRKRAEKNPVGRYCRGNRFKQLQS